MIRFLEFILSVGLVFVTGFHMGVRAHENSFKHLGFIGLIYQDDKVDDRTSADKVKLQHTSTVSQAPSNNSDTEADSETLRLLKEREAANGAGTSNPDLPDVNPNSEYKGQDTVRNRDMPEEDNAAALRRIENYEKNNKGSPSHNGLEDSPENSPAEMQPENDVIMNQDPIEQPPEELPAEPEVAE
jgi:hypothetical protein